MSSLKSPNPSQLNHFVASDYSIFRQTTPSSNAKRKPSSEADAGQGAPNIIPNGIKTEILPPPNYELRAATDETKVVECFLNSLSDGAADEELLDTRDTSASIAQLLVTGLDTVPAWKRFLLSHCQRINTSTLGFGTDKQTVSDNIAPSMVAIDDDLNGYRVLLLQIAKTDDLVMNVVLSASAYHLSSKSPNLLQLGHRLQTATIQGLIYRRDLGNNDNVTNHFNILTMLMLLVIEMITGGPDFPTVFAMLKSGLKAMGGESSLGVTSLGKFLIHQTRKHVWLLFLFRDPLIMADFLP